MRKLLFLLTIPAWGAITNLRQSSATPTSVILRYVPAITTNCTIEVSEFASYTPLVHDVDTSLFSGSNSDFRNGSQGRERALVIGSAGTGIQYAPVALSGYKTSRALQANTLHYYRLTCGSDISTGTVQTNNLPAGDTFPATVVPVDPTRLGEAGWPYLAWDGSAPVIDPITGVYIQQLRKMNEQIAAGTDLPGVLSFGYVYDDSATWVNPNNIKVDDAVYATTTSSNPIRVYSLYQQPVLRTTLTGLTLSVHGFVDNVTTTTQACLSIDGATCFGPWINFTLPVGAPGTVNVGDTVNANPAGMLQGWLSAGQAGPTPYDTSARSGSADNTGAALSMHVPAGGNGSFDYRWAPTSHVLYNSVDYTVASVQTASKITLGATPPSNLVSAPWFAMNFGFMIRRSSGAGTVSIDSAKFQPSLHQTYQTNGGDGGFSPCTTARYPQGWRIGTPNGGVGTNFNAATNTSPIVLTSTSTIAAGDLSVGDTIKVRDVPNNTAANGTWVVSAINYAAYTGGSTVTLTGSNGTSSGVFPDDSAGAPDYVVAYGGGGIFWKVGSPTGMLCFLTDGNGGVNQYWMNDAVTPVHIEYLGVSGANIKPPLVNVAFSGPSAGALDTTTDPEIPFTWQLVLNSGKQELWKGYYTGMRNNGMFRDIGPNFQGGQNNSNATDTWHWAKTAGAIFQDQVLAFDATTTGLGFGLGGFPKPNTLSFTARGSGGYQNGIGWQGIYNVLTHTVTALMNTAKSANSRWCGLHTSLAWSGADYYSYVPYELIGVDGSVNPPYYGPYRVFPTSGNLPNTTSSCSAQLTALSLTNPLGIATSDCSTIILTSNMPITPATFTPANDTLNSNGIRIGDLMSINTAGGGVGGLGLYDSERIKVIGFSGNTIVAQRGAASTSILTHASGWNANMFCSVTPLWWNYPIAPTGETGTDPYSTNLKSSGIFSEQAFAGESHFFTSGPVSVADSPNIADIVSATPGFTCPTTSSPSHNAGYGMRNYAWPNHLSAPLANMGCVAGNPEFDGAFGNGEGQRAEKHPSSCVAPGCNSFFDARPYLTYSLWSQTVSKVGTYVYKVTSYGDSSGFDEKRNKINVAVGHKPTYDVSAAGFILPDTIAYNYTYCLTHVAGECWAASSLGDVYVNAPFASTVPIGWQDNPGQYRCIVRHENWSDTQLNDICVAIQAADADYTIQYPLTSDPFNTGTRRISGSLAMVRTSGNLYNAPVIANDRWQVNWNGYINDGQNYMSTLVKIPPYQGIQKGINRGSWIPIPITITNVPAGTSTVTVDFGYNPSFQCSTRLEVCLTVDSTISAAPYYYASDTFTKLACASGCTPVIPALSQRMMWSRIKYWNAGGTVIKTGDTQVMATP